MKKKAGYMDMMFKLGQDLIQLLHLRLYSQD